MKSFLPLKRRRKDDNLDTMMKFERIYYPLIFVLVLALFVGCPGKKKPIDPDGPDETQKVEIQDILPEGKPYTVPDLDMQMIWVPPGKFVMGSPKSEPGHRLDEEELHQVIISRGFWIGQFEVSQAQFETILGENPSTFKDPLMPVHKVNWEEAMEFCEALTDREKSVNRMPDKWGFNLPTEAQWEYACRADTTTVFHFGNEAEELSQYGWFVDNSDGSPKTIGTKKPNAWGIHDLHGNMGEWCFDWYGKAYPVDGSVDPITKKASAFKVFRGGTYTDISDRCRAAYRNRITPDTRNPWIGFRVVLMRKYFE
jgi:formylglycine-generating enzyme required for sulfatase activity